MTKRTITVVGAGYVGMSVAVLLAQSESVTIAEIMPERVRMINKGISPVRDLYIEQYLRDKKLDLRAVEVKDADYAEADYVIIATPTNYDPGKNRFDTSSIESTVSEVMRQKPDAVIVIKSTVPIGYCRMLKERFNISRLLFCPEFLRESKALYDNLYPSRIIAGIGNDKERSVAEDFCSMLASNSLIDDVTVLFMGYTEAESVKLFANTYLAMRVAFFNELDTFAQEKGLDPQAVIEGVCTDPRIGEVYNNPSFGYGGYCLPKDSKQLLAHYGGIPETLIGAVVSSNRTRITYSAQRILKMAQEKHGNKKGPCVIGAYRLAMKKDSDNFRESATVAVMEALKGPERQLLIYEPAMEEGSEICGGYVTGDFKTFAQKCDVIVANRYDPVLEAYQEKLYTRDLYGCD